jgi:predicted small metal-binding protein
MAKEMRCRDIGFDCPGVIKADTEAEVMTQAAAHAKTVHHIDALDDEMKRKMRLAIHEEKK